MPSAEDILWYKDNVPLSPDLSHALSVNTSQLTVINSTFNDSGNYGCGFQEDSYGEMELIVVTVALEPSPVQNLTCKSYDVLHIHCTWEEGAVDTNTRNIHKAHFRDYGKTDLKEVDESTDYSCQFMITDNTKVFVQVTSTNSLGSVMTEVLFNSQTQVTPNQPENIRAEPNTTNGNSIIQVRWDSPSGWYDDFFSLEYRVRYRSEESSEMREKNTDGIPRALLEDLKPFTTYIIEVSAKSPVAGDLYWGEPGIIEATTLDGPPFGSVSGVSLQSETNSITAGLRHVEIQWQAPPMHEWGSESIRYEVHLIPQDFSPYLSLKEYKDTVSVPSILVQDVSKYQTYSIKITPFNNAGKGPETAFRDVVPDRTSAPGKPAGLNVTLISDTLKIRWQPPKKPNGIIYVYQVIVIGDAVLSTNESDVAREAMLTTQTESQVIHVAVNCTEFTKKGLPMEVMVAALTKNYTNHIFQGDWANFTQDGVCKEKDERPNFLFIGIFIPCSVIVSCIIALLLWNFFKDTCVDPPDIHHPNKIYKPGGIITIGNIKPIEKQEKEIFDDPKPMREISDISDDITRGPQSLSYIYLNPRNEPKNGIERINSHDSGMPESPGSQCGDAMEFYNQGFLEESVDVHHGPIQSISRNVSSGQSDGVSSSWRQSGISNTSEDSGAEVMVKENGIILDPRSTSSSTDELPSPDPYFKVSALPPSSSQSRDISSRYIKTPLGQDERMQKVEENGDEDKFDENDCPFDDDDSSSGYLQQYQLGSPTSLTSEVPPYMAMTPISPLPVSSCVPNGYVPAESLPCPVKKTTEGVLAQKGYVPEEYSTMVDSQAVTAEGYLKHDVIPTPKQISETPASYIKHTLLPSIDGNYLDNYPDFNHNIPPGPILGPPQGPTLGSKQESGVYVQHQDISTSLLKEPAYISNRSENSNSSEMPYSKLAVSDYTQY